KSVLDSLPADRHSFRQAFEPCLHLVQDAFVLPAFDAFDFIGRAVGLERARQAGRQIAVVINIVTAVWAPPPFCQMVASRAGEAVMRCIVDKVRPAKEPAVWIV